MPTSSDFFSLYLDAAGEMEVPEVFHRWSAISLIAACLNDRCWLEKFPGEKLYPNLSILLCGESGSGKDLAIGHASRIAKNLEGIYRFRGKLSGAGLIDVLTQPKVREASYDGRPTVWLVFPELANSIGVGERANDFIKRITDLSKGEDDLYQEATRQLLAEERSIEYPVPVLNGLWGSTVDWLLEAVTPQAVNSGAFARILAVEGTYKGPRIPQPWKNARPNHKELIERLHSWCDDITKMEGLIKLSPHAEAIQKRWYEDRPEPSDRRLHGAWRREDDHNYKIAMAVAAPRLAQTTGPLIIEAKEYIKAQRLVAVAHANLPNLLRWAARSGKMNQTEVIADMIKRADRIVHSALLKRVNHHGIHAYEMKEALAQLIQRGDVMPQRTKSGARVYEWKRRGR